MNRFSKRKSLWREFIYENKNGVQYFSNGYLPDNNNSDQYNTDKMRDYLIGDGGVGSGGGPEEPPDDDGGGASDSGSALPEEESGTTGERVDGDENGRASVDGSPEEESGGASAEFDESGPSGGRVDGDENGSESGDDDDDECIIARTDFKHPLFTYLLYDPAICSLPYEYLRFNFKKLKCEIERSSPFRETRDHGLKAWITADSFYVRLEGENMEDIDIVVAYDNGQVTVIGLHTHMHHMGLNLGCLTQYRFDNLIEDVCKRFIENEKCLLQSGWSYYKTDEIRVHFAVVSGRNIRKTRSGGNKFRTNKQKKPPVLKKFINYPKGFRGTRSVINIDYTRLVKNKKEKCHKGKGSPCVKYALKAHMINTSPIIPPDIKQTIMEKLSKSETMNLDNLSKHYLLEAQVSMPDSITIKNFSLIETMNKCAVIVYFIHRFFYDGLVEYSLSCVRAPKRGVLMKYTIPPCHLLMISTNHVAYIPDITSYLGAVFDDPDPDRVRRCKYCFALFPDSTKLKDHYIRGECYLSSPIPTHINLPEPGDSIEFIKKLDLLPRELVCILDIECSLIPPTLQTPPLGEDSDSNYQPLFKSISNESVPAGTISHIHVPVSIGLCYLDKDYNILSHKLYIDDDIESHFPKIIVSESKKHLEIVRSQRVPICYMTAEDTARHEATEMCAICETPFCVLPSFMKHADHCHYTLPVFDKESGNLLIGNYRQSLCKECNNKLTEKRDTVTVIAHNMSFYDFPALLKGFVDNTDNLKTIKVIPKGAHSYYRVQFENIDFIDSLSFIPGSLASLVELKCKNIENEGVDIAVPLTAQMTRSEYCTEMLEYIGRKQTFPYTLCKSVRAMESIKDWPSREAFFNDLAGEPVSEQDYEFGLRVWTSLKKHVGSENMNLLVLHKWYLYCDIMLLADIWSWFSNVTKEKFGVYPSNYITGPAMSYAAALKMGETELEKLTDAQMYSDFETLLRGGFCGVSKRVIRANNVEMGELYNPSLSDILILILDWSQLYSCLLKDHIPYANFSYLQFEDPISINDILSIDPTSDQGFIFIVDIVIPEHLKLLYDDLPLGLILVDKIKPSGYTSDLLEDSDRKPHGKRLVAGHFSLCQYGFHVRLLQFYLQVGCELTKIHDIIVFDQKPVFKPFIEVCVSQREIHRDIPILNKLFKLMGNSLYGRTILNTRKYNTDTILVRKKTLSRHLNNPRCRKIRLVGKDSFLVTKSKLSVTLEAPIYIGAVILQLAKLRNFRFHYFLAKPSGSDFPLEQFEQVIKNFITPEEYEIVLKSRGVIKSVTLAYTDTDSLHYEVVMNKTGLTFNDLVSNYVFSLHMDRSNFKVLAGNPSTFDSSRDELYKSEISDSIAVEGVYVSPKCYSIRVLPRQAPNSTPTTLTPEKVPVFQYKKTMKSCPASLLDKNFSHDYYKEVVNEGIVLNAKPVETSHIKFNEKIGRHTTTKLKRRPMTAIDIKRCYENPLVSYGYEHPKSLELGYKVGDILSTKGGYILGTEHLIDIQDVRKFNSVSGDESIMEAVVEIGNDADDVLVSDVILGEEGPNPTADTLDAAMRISGITAGEPLDMLVSLMEESNVILFRGEEDELFENELEEDEAAPHKRRRL